MKESRRGSSGRGNRAVRMWGVHAWVGWLQLATAVVAVMILHLAAQFDASLISSSTSNCDTLPCSGCYTVLPCLWRIVSTSQHLLGSPIACALCSAACCVSAVEFLGYSMWSRCVALRLLEVRAKDNFARTPELLRFVFTPKLPAVFSEAPRLAASLDQSIVGSDTSCAGPTD